MRVMLCHDVADNHFDVHGGAVIYVVKELLAGQARGSLMAPGSAPGTERSREEGRQFPIP